MRWVLSVVVVAVVSLLVFAGGAFGAVTGLELRTDSGATDSVSPKSASVSCPTGKQVTGAAAAKTHGAFGQVRLLAARPSSDLRTVTTSFREDENGFAGDWQPTAYALCAPLPGLQRVVKTSASSSVNKNVTASCPSGKQLVGLGGETVGGAGQVVIEVMRPDSALKAAVVSAREDQNGFAGTWTVTAHAICAPAPQGLQRVSAAGQVTSGGPDVVAECPAGKGLLGVGGEVSGQSGQVSLETYALPGSGEPTSAVARAFEDEDGYAPAWNLTAYAICANTATRIAFTGPRDSIDQKFEESGCPAGKQATGAGGEITGGLGQVELDSIGFRNPPTSVFASAREDQDLHEGTWSVTGYGICSSPLTGLERVSAESDLDSALSKTAEASCPAGKRLVGAGFTSVVIGSREPVVLAHMAPNAALTSATAIMEEDQDGTGNAWRVTAHAVCANPPPGLEFVVRTVNDSDSPEIQDVSASCPTGKHLLGTGAGISQGLGEVFLDDLRPSTDLKSVAVRAVEDQDGRFADWTLAAYAICANP